MRLYASDLSTHVHTYTASSLRFAVSSMSSSKRLHTSNQSVVRDEGGEEAGTTTVKRACVAASSAGVAGEAGDTGRTAGGGEARVVIPRWRTGV
jgi:microcystin-dependent protein